MSDEPPASAPAPDVTDPEPLPGGPWRLARVGPDGTLQAAAALDHLFGHLGLATSPPRRQARVLFDFLKSPIGRLLPLDLVQAVEAWDDTTAKAWVAAGDDEYEEADLVIPEDDEPSRYTIVLDDSVTNSDWIKKREHLQARTDEVPPVPWPPGTSPTPVSAWAPASWGLVLDDGDGAPRLLGRLEHLLAHVGVTGHARTEQAKALEAFLDLPLRYVLPALVRNVFDWANADTGDAGSPTRNGPAWNVWLDEQDGGRTLVTTLPQLVAYLGLAGVAKDELAGGLDEFLDSSVGAGTPPSLRVQIEAWGDAYELEWGAED